MGDISISFYSGAMKKVRTLVSEFAYEPHEIVGSTDDPYILELAPIVPIVPSGPVMGGIAIMPLNIIDTSYTGAERFDFFAYDPIYFDYLGDTTRSIFCISDGGEDGYITFYADADADGLGNPLDSIFSCITPEGYVDNNDDCDDTGGNSVNDIVISETSGYASDDGVICAGSTMDLSAPDGVITYSWSDGQSGKDISVTPDESTTYEVTMFFNDCVDIKSTEILVEGLIVTDSANDGFGSLRSILSCAADGDSITYNQPDILFSDVTTTLDIDKSISIHGLDIDTRPEIILDFGVISTGFDITSNKVLSLENVDLKLLNSDDNKPTIEGGGSLSVTGYTKVIEE